MNKQNFNLHTHTARCGHAEGLDIQYIHSAMDAGIQLLGFSEHIPYPEMRLANCRMFYEDKDAYIDTMHALKQTYKDKIDILVGYEVEYMEDKLAYLLDMRKECDYMILGQHCKYIGYEYDCYCNDEDVLFYTSQIEQALAKGFITYVAHPDYFMMGRRHFNDVCEEAAHRIAKASLQYDVALEVNLNGFRYGKKQYSFQTQGKQAEERYVYPFYEFWEIIARYGCKVVYGYDAHSPIVFLEDNRLQLAQSILGELPLQFVDKVVIR